MLCDRAPLGVERADQDGQAVVDEIKAAYNPVEVLMSEITPVLGVHGGPGILAVALRDKGL